MPFDHVTVHSSVDGARNGHQIRDTTIAALETVIQIARSRANPFEGIACLISGSLSGLLTAFNVEAKPDHQASDTSDLVNLLKRIVAARSNANRDDPRVRFLQDLETLTREEAQRLRELSPEFRN